MLLAAVVLKLVVFHSVEGREIAVDPYHVTAIQAPKRAGEPGKLFVDTVHCIIALTDGKYVTVAEGCEEVKQKLEGAYR
jgi:hypothetical protein